MPGFIGHEFAGICGIAWPGTPLREEFYTVHDTAGHEVRLHVDKTRHLEGPFKAGDKVEAYVTHKGHTRFGNLRSWWQWSGDTK
jgi:hypothetical protein